MSNKNCDEVKWSKPIDTPINIKLINDQMEPPKDIEMHQKLVKG